MFDLTVFLFFLQLFSVANSAIRHTPHRPQDVLEGYERADAHYCVGWSRGREACHDNLVTAAHRGVELTRVAKSSVVLDMEYKSPAYHMIFIGFDMCRCRSSAISFSLIYWFIGCQIQF